MRHLFRRNEKFFEILLKAIFSHMSINKFISLIINVTRFRFQNKHLKLENRAKLIDYHKNRDRRVIRCVALCKTVVPASSPDLRKNCVCSTALFIVTIFSSFHDFEQCNDFDRWSLITNFAHNTRILSRLFQLLDP